ncbi:hypothetical protein KXD93_24895 [Mucilaginibacter sp. BJC16-A38]|uniref:hypothetical protein n=1 Tax=Mucilaginibacter phenanthrenivorans TaxID=1234842 RepID=UPI0021571CA0|nr:hypothetical protein [Mucilaginibacter phenanthrenivorans]MCR8560919.1 hypothetical protein [Mucilaginibacter phenanthrenivorans]
MNEIIKRRTIRPSTRLKTSEFYRVDINKITASDTLIVNVTHESKPFQKTFKFKGSEVIKKKSLGFKVVDNGEHIHLNWTSTQPINGK